ncbi:hypothetical protein ACIRPX_04010 [Streptomyces sp. NPDC101225]|uniref:hypothetical protein n=1 Tax=Streptomyces sp. NPDC101225 TaxID=3366135 RepID=UPI0037FCC910
MGLLRLTLCTGFLAGCALAPGAAYAADGGGAGLSVTPSSPAAGSDVTLRATGCTLRTATAASTAFVADARLSGAGGTLTGDTRVRTVADPGSYDVRIACGESVITGRITVVARTRPQTQGERQPQDRQQPQDQQRVRAQRPPSPAAPAAPASPVAPVDAGGGGTAHFASVDVRGAGPGTGQTITGVVLAGAAAGSVGLLSARRRRGTD